MNKTGERVWNVLILTVAVPCLFLFLAAILVGCNQGVAQAEEYSNDQICDAIWNAEGGTKTKYPYGIKSVKCEGENECRQICINTVRNNRERFKYFKELTFPNQGTTKRIKDARGTYVGFLARRYCPFEEDEGGDRTVYKISDDLCEHWEGNVRYFLTKGDQ